LIDPKAFGERTLPYLAPQVLVDVDHSMEVMREEGAALALGPRIETGTVFMNRCDYLDPYLAWTGVKDSGRGATLSRLGYEGLTRPQSFHLRLAQG